MTSAGPTKSTAVGEIVSIAVTPDGPYGVAFEPDNYGCAGVITDWTRLPNGKFGPIQKHG